MRISKKTFIFLSSAVCSVLFVSLAIPLIKRNVPPNAVYGIRIPKSLESEELWYQINHIGGWALVYAALFMLGSNVLLFLFRKKVSTSAYAGLFLALLLLTVFLAAGITHHHASPL